MQSWQPTLGNKRLHSQYSLRCRSCRWRMGSLPPPPPPLWWCNINRFVWQMWLSMRKWRVGSHLIVIRFGKLGRRKSLLLSMHFSSIHLKSHYAIALPAHSEHNNTMHYYLHSPATLPSLHTSIMVKPHSSMPYYVNRMSFAMLPKPRRRDHVLWTIRIRNGKILLVRFLLTMHYLQNDIISSHPLFVATLSYINV